MIHHRLGALRAAVALGDVTAVLAAFVVASHLRFGAGWHQIWRETLPAFELAIVGLAITVLAVFHAAGLYRLDRRRAWRREVAQLCNVGTLVVAGVLATLFLFKLQDVSRLFLALFFPLVGAAVVAQRAVVHLLLTRLRARGRAQRRILIVGSGERAADFARRAIARPELGACIIGYVDDRPRDLTGYPRLGDIADLPTVLGEQVVDEVAVCLPFSMWPVIDMVARACEQQGKAVLIPVDLMAHAIDRGRLIRIEGLPALAIPNAPDNSGSLAAKRVIDIVGSVVLLTVSAPLLLSCALAVRVLEGPPVLFRQRRGGLHGRPFHALKFRTMVPDAEGLQAQLAGANERSGPAFKITHDPRVTRVGQFLRRTSLDELPQLFNVLRGDMSLVGPRPPALSEVDEYAWWHRRRLSVKPGMTGLWQVSARGEPDFNRWVEIDLHYIDHWSLWSDVKVLARTPLALIRTPGA